MIAVITGDVINSRGLNANIWLHELKDALGRYGEEPKAWEIYRGDSFQLAIEPNKLLEAYIYIKASLKKHKNINARMAIGLGHGTLTGKVTESNGMAFHRSGEAFDIEISKKKKEVYLIGNNQASDEILNSILSLISIIISNWTPKACIAIIKDIESGEINQSQLAKELGVTQSAISQSYKHSGWEIMRDTITLFPKLIEQ